MIALCYSELDSESIIRLLESPPESPPFHPYRRCKGEEGYRVGKIFGSGYSIMDKRGFL